VLVCEKRGTEKQRACILNKVRLSSRFGRTLAGTTVTVRPLPKRLLHRTQVEMKIERFVLRFLSELCKESTQASVYDESK
jgi:hypothetical protein